MRDEAAPPATFRKPFHPTHGPTRMESRVGLLRAGYIALGFSILCLAGSFTESFGWLVLLSPVFALVGAICLAFSGDDIPKWAGIAFLVYAGITLVAFIATTPATIRLSFWRGWANADPHPVAAAVADYLVLAMMLMPAATALVAAWEREHGPRLLLMGAVVGLVAVGVLTVVLDPTPESPPVDTETGRPAVDIAGAQEDAEAQARLLGILLALSAAAGAAGAWWAAWRPEEYH